MCKKDHNYFSFAILLKNSWSKISIWAIKFYYTNKKFDEFYVVLVEWSEALTDFFLKIAHK